MNYELAKQLKDAGFPQDIKEDYYYDGCEECEGGNPESYIELYHLIHDKSDLIKIPTLSELIEACGRDFDRLERIGNTNTWNVKGFFSDIETEGETPEEAVAKL